MHITLRTATLQDFDFAFEAKRHALGPHVRVRWTWDEVFQLGIHSKRWIERPWFIIQAAGSQIGTLAVAEHADHIRFGSQ